MTATMSIDGLYDYDNNIFQNFNVPTGMDKDVAIKDILFNCYGFEVLFPNPDIMKIAIGNWSTIELPKWQKTYDALELEYNVIENYDRTEDWTDNGSNNTSSSGSVIPNLTNTTTNSKTAFNTDAMKEAEKSVLAQTGSSTSSNTTNGTDSSAHHGHIHGNIGVTTAPTMQTEYIDKIASKSVYDMITESFKNRFCLLVY